MTQPPPPPNQPPGPPPGQPPNQPPSQPPGGGFGLSKEQPQQPAGGYGTPPPPQNQPPGHPQTPPQAQPPAGPGYGYPQAAPQSPPPGAPYGYPQQGAPGQPAYSAPTQPMQAQPARAGGSGGFLNKTQLQIVVAACLAIVLIIGGGFWYSTTKDDGGKQDQAKNSSDGTGGEDGDKEGKGGEDQAAPDGPGTEKAPADPASKVAFQLPLPPRIDVTGVPGSWVTDKAYVKTGVNSIEAYDVAKGSKLWSLPMPGQVCAASRRTTEDDKTAVVFEDRKRTKSDKGYPPCSEVGVVDLTTGKLLWSKSVTGGSSGDGKARFDQVTISGNTVAAGYLGGSAAFDLATGAVRWKPTVDAEQCKDIGYAGGKALIAVRRCGSYDDPQVTIQALNPEDGTPLSSFKMPEGVEDARVVSSDPLVVAADVGDTGMFGISDFFSIDVKTGKLRAKIAAPGDKYLARCPASDGVEGCQFVVVGNDRLYLPTEEHEGTGESYSRTNEIVAFDLATGKAVSGRADAGDGYHSLPLRMDGGNVIAYKWPPYDKGGQVVSINGATLKETVLLVNPADKTVRDAETSFVETGSEYHFRNGRLFIADDTLSKPSSDSSSSSKYLAISFGPKG